MEFRQFKLTNGDELICEVMQWNEEDTLEIIVRKAMKLVYVDDYESGSRYYHFRPWMLLQENADDMLVLNADHVIAEGTPSHKLVEYYKGVLNEYNVFLANTQHTEDEPESYDTVDDFVDSFDIEPADGEKKQVH